MPFLAGQQAWNRGKTKETDLRVRKISETLKAKRIDNFAQWRCRARRLGKFPRSERLRIALGTDKPLLWQHVAKVVRNVFSKEPWVQQRKQAACVDISLYQTRLSERLGVPTGDRRKLAVRLPEWIWSDRQHLVACLKGLFEAEGSYSTHAPTYTYNLSFSNRNPALLDEVERALVSLGFHPERRSYAVRLRKKQEASHFIELIRFRSYNS